MIKHIKKYIKDLFDWDMFYKDLEIVHYFDIVRNGLNSGAFDIGCAKKCYIELYQSDIDYDLKDKACRKFQHFIDGLIKELCIAYDIPRHVLLKDYRRCE